MSYTCAMCGETFEPDWAEEEAIAEMKADFGDIPIEECDVVCDDCYQIIKPSANPLEFEIYKAAQEFLNSEEFKQTRENIYLEFEKNFLHGDSKNKPMGVLPK